MNQRKEYRVKEGKILFIQGIKMPANTKLMLSDKQAEYFKASLIPLGLKNKPQGQEK